MIRISIAGLVRVRIITADISATLHRLTARGIEVYNVSRKKEVELQLDLPKEGIPALREICGEMGNTWSPVGYKGVYWKAIALLNRPVFLFGILFVLAMTVFLSRRVLFYEIVGNEAIPQEQILQLTQSSGLEFGTSRAGVRSEAVKNQMLSSLEKLQWVGINTQGCVATIRVQERTVLPPQEVGSSVSNLVAAQDGIVTRVIIQSGDARCEVGQAVKKGQLLVSPYTDCGFKILAQRPQGQVFALTNRAISCVTPSSTTSRGEEMDSWTTFSLQIGKNRINLSNRSGISTPSCAKITQIKQLVLPGGFALPVYWIREEYKSYQSQAQERSASMAEARLQQFAQDVLSASMTSGKMLQRSAETYSVDGLYCLRVRVACEEMIAEPGGTVFEGD